jgi:hypothetical protein
MDRVPSTASTTLALPSHSVLQSTDDFFLSAPGLARPGILEEPPKDGRGFRDFYHNWTNSFLQQLKRKLQVDCSEFHE